MMRSDTFGNQRMALGKRPPGQPNPSRRFRMDPGGGCRRVPAPPARPLAGDSGQGVRVETAG